MAEDHIITIVRPGFFDTDLACLFKDIKSTSICCVQCAVVIQRLSRLISKGPGKSIITTVPELRNKHFPYWSESILKRLLMRLRKLGVIRAQHLPNQTRFWIDHRRITKLAKEVLKEKERMVKVKEPLKIENSGPLRIERRPNMVTMPMVFDKRNIDENQKRCKYTRT